VVVSAAVASLLGLELGERCAVDGEVVGEAERERGEVLFGLTRRGQGGRGMTGFALVATSASVLERPRAVWALGDRSVLFSAVVSHHRHSQLELYHHHLALDCFRNG
jgi:hypothetical protein